VIGCRFEEKRERGRERKGERANESGAKRERDGRESDVDAEMTDRSKSGLECGAWMAIQINSGGVDTHTNRRPQGKKRHQDDIRLTRYEHPRNRVLNRASAQSHPCTDATHRTRALVYHTQNEHNNGYPNDTGDVEFTWSTIRSASRGCFCQIFDKSTHGMPVDQVN